MKITSLYHVCADGIKLAEKFHVKFIETSATLNQNVEQLFQGIISQIRLKGLERSSLDRRMTSKLKNDVISYASKENMRFKSAFFKFFLGASDLRLL